MSIVSTEHPNAALVRRGYVAFNTADMETLEELFHEDACWHTPGRGPLAGSHQGRDAVFAHFGQYGGLTAGTFRANLQEVLTNEDGTVVGIHRNTAERDGKTLDVVLTEAIKFNAEGKVTEAWALSNDQRGYEQFYS